MPFGADLNGASCGCTCPWEGDQGAAQGWEWGHGGRASRPNISVQPTPYSSAPSSAMVRAGAVHREWHFIRASDCNRAFKLTSFARDTVVFMMHLSM